MSFVDEAPRRISGLLLTRDSLFGRIFKVLMNFAMVSDSICSASG